MRIDITEVKPKNNVIKIIILVIVAVIFVAVFSTLGMHYAKAYKAKLIAEKKQYVINYLENNKKDKIIKENLTVSKDNTDISERENVIKILTPVYSENAKTKMNNIYNVNSKIAYLTFDDGPSRAVTPLILDLLKEENVKATFFVLGTNVKTNPDIVKRAYLEGHYIANHGYTHNYSKIYDDAKNVLEEYEKAEKQIRKAIGNDKYSSYLFRFPGGYEGGKYASIKKQAGKLLNKNNISYLDWNVLTGDAEGANTKEKILKNIEKHTKDKGNIVVLMHDSSSKILTYETLRDVINYLRNLGYTFDNFYSIMQ